MSTIRNKVQLIGNLSYHPEIIRLKAGGILAKFSVATNESYKNSKGEKVTDTQWHDIVAWGKTAEIVQKYVGKEREVVVEGRLTYRVYEDKEGIKQYISEVVCSQILMLGKK